MPKLFDDKAAENDTRARSVESGDACLERREQPRPRLLGARSGRRPRRPAGTSRAWCRHTPRSRRAHSPCRRPRAAAPCLRVALVVAGGDRDQDVRLHLRHQQCAVGLVGGEAAAVERAAGTDALVSWPRCASRSGRPCSSRWCPSCAWCPPRPAVEPADEGLRAGDVRLGVQRAGERHQRLARRLVVEVGAGHRGRRTLTR